ncbi:hypothetical protein [Sphingopyxis sp.]|uniref:hypothetical protein n=2 Tax=Pseudomonadota TaxID=1224 RepID=UPI003F7073D6
MAKGSTSKPGNSKIRFIMIEADLSEGDLSQVTQAIQNALRPAQQPVRMLQAPLDRTPRAQDLDFEEVDLNEDLEEESIDTAKPKPQRNSKPKVAKTPEVLDDIDVNAEPSLKDFVGRFDLKSNFDKYLVIALWFRDARGVNAITVDHVYTCFRILGWSTASTDFSKPLQNLKGEQSLRGNAKDGYSLSLTGAGKIEAKKRPE